MQMDQYHWWMQGLDLPLSATWSKQVPLGLATFFFLYIYQKVAVNPQMFFKRHGRKHALTGLVYLLWITMGFINVAVPLWPEPFLFVFHAILGILGTVLTLLAAQEFPHKHIKNFASGTLDEHATVTSAEMLEHAFYQALNLLQVCYFHALHLHLALPYRLLGLVVVTMPWYIRASFPLHSFSENYSEKIDSRSSTLIRVLYRIKKYQYVFYKHFLLHGMNISLALSGVDIIASPCFRLYWLLLNTSYVMEFFLQTLVKKQYLPQEYMLSLQQVLMFASSLVAVMVLKDVSIFLALLSLAANFANRKHDVLNTVLVAGVGVGLLWLGV